MPLLSNLVCLFFFLVECDDAAWPERDLHERDASQAAPHLCTVLQGLLPVRAPLLSFTNALCTQ